MAKNGKFPLITMVKESNVSSIMIAAVKNSPYSLTDTVPPLPSIETWVETPSIVNSAPDKIW
eukprot:CAMPEP_0118706080 /NCGR_PEP_ID=MMETSP0800-20121206/20316_1 /TAXON_ID=210618 ORGANISM="Striatella unipunctata, Strain CCMP2910" /NCGR_SAMPLE_ID=MMETSP0800 /ASSEMBLY_ACC=CAM_ASM_000638 /LENGTH=61 /DNA_ID=CAMNT_0006608489 /DNA_START=137 /DNA_END=319 /DNA_ORIENTATION=-